MFPGTSTLVLISIPVSVWLHLEDRTAHRFVDFIAVDAWLEEVDPAIGTHDINAGKETTAEEEQGRWRG